MRKVIPLLAAFALGIGLGTVVLSGNRAASIDPAAALSATQATDPQSVMAAPKSSIGLKGNIAFLVQEVTPAGPGDKAGLKKGDIIMRVNGKQFASINDFLQFTQSEPGTVHQFSLFRHEDGARNAYTMEVSTVLPLDN